jgi:hypothetical protein
MATVAAGVLSSCAKDEFTERQALGLELQRLRAQREIDSLQRQQQRAFQVNTMRYQRALDSLDRINAGGRVFYTVAVVAGGNAAFGAGRSEELEGVQGATVSVAQYGQVVTQTTPASGLATFELRSGSATIVASAPAHTTVNYVVNLTPDGSSTASGLNGNGMSLANAPGNGTTVYVSNVMPLFPTTGAGTATVRGLALIESNLTNEVPETVTPALLGAGSNLFTANIDINAAFRAKYLANSFSNTSLNSNGSGFEGDIQRVAYENATTAVTVGADGAYSGVVPATASGLPIRLEYSDIALNRTWWAGTFDGVQHNAVINRRFVYGPRATATGGITTGTLPASTASVTNSPITVVTTEATGTVAITNTGALQTEEVAGVTYFVFDPAATGAARYVPDGDAGAYLADVTRAALAAPGQVVPPTVTFPAPTTGTTAVGTVELSAPAGGTNLRTVVGVRVGDAGAGYSGDVSPTFSAGGNDTGVTGRGTLQSPSDQVGSIQVIDGGFGFRTSGPAPYGTPAQWTERAPTILFNGNATLPAPKVTPTVQYVRDGAIAGFTNGVSNVGTTLGTIQSISLASAGSGITPADLTTVTFDYGSGAVIPANDGAANGGDALFVASGSGALEFNPAYGTGTTANVLNLVTSLPTAAGMSRGARPYVFVPTASLTGNTAGTNATFAVTIDAAGLVFEVRIATPGSGFTTAGVSAASVVVSTPSNSLSARGFLRGTGIDNYVFDAATLPGVVVATKNTQPPALPPYSGVASANNYIVRFDAPASGGTRAAGIPVFDSQNRIVGIEITNPGVGYTGPVPFRIVAASAGTAFAPAGGAEGSIGTVARGITITTTGGTGYSLAPQVFFAGGGRQLSDQRNSVDNAGDFNVRVNQSNGDLVEITYSGPFYWDNDAVGAANAGPDPIRVIISAENHRINVNKAWFDLRNGRTGVAVGQGVIAAESNTAGALTGIKMRTVATVNTSTPAGISTLSTDTIKWYEATAPNPYFSATPFIIAPRITIATPTGGTAATGVFVLEGSVGGAPVSGGANGGKIRAFLVTNGGAGYRTPPTPTNGLTVPTAGRNFTIFNGELTNFETFSGITYVRDIHYGTGQYVDN